MAFKVRQDHWQVLLESMEAHPVLATGKFVGPQGRENYKKAWDNTTKKLNSLGFGNQRTEKWQKTWTDYKYNLKRKAAAVKRSISQTGGGLSNEETLSDIDLRLLDILGQNFVGFDEPEVGFMPSRQLQQNALSVDEPMPSTSGTQSSFSPIVEIQFSSTETSPIPEATTEEYTRPASDSPVPKKKKKQEVKYLQEYRETINELRDIKDTVQESLNEIATALVGIREELCDLNQNLTQILLGQQQQLL